MKSLGELLMDRLAIATAPSPVGRCGTPTRRHPMWVGHKDAASFRLWHLVVASLSIQNLSTAKTSAQLSRRYGVPAGRCEECVGDSTTLGVSPAKRAADIPFSNRSPRYSGAAVASVRAARRKLVKLFRKPNSRFYWYDFTVRARRYRGSTQETKSVRAVKAASLRLASVIEGTDPLPRTSK
jgi:hypothetical protein